MVTINKVLTSIKWILVLVWALTGYSRIHYYGVFTSNGSDKVTSTNTIEINDHGSLVYITSHQYHILTYLIYTSVFSFIIAVIIDLYQRKRFPSREKY
jgi:hypothetical protein